MSEPTEHIVSNYDALNAHAEGVVDNEKQLRRLKRFRADRVFIKNLGLLLMLIGIFAILLSTAYYIYKKYSTAKPIYEVVDKPVYINNTVIRTVETEVPYKKIVFRDKEIIVEVPVPTPPSSSFGKFTKFHVEPIDKDGIGKIITGKRYESSGDFDTNKTHQQYCYATSPNNPDNDITLAILKGGKVEYGDLFSTIRAFSPGASTDEIKRLRRDLRKAARKYCKFELDLKQKSRALPSSTSSTENNSVKK
jgi:hypothetical protein